jgi:hypothetical protein
MGILAQRAIRAPGSQRPGGAPVPVVGCIANLIGRQVQSNDIRGMARDETAALLGIDDVVRRRDDEPEITHA